MTTADTRQLMQMPAPDRTARSRARDRRLSNLGDEIAKLSAQIQAATYRMLVMLREFDEEEGWNQGFRSCAHWLTWRTGIALGASREKVRVARALADLPRISRAMERGEVSSSGGRTGLVLVAESALRGGLDPGTRGDRYQVVLHVDRDRLAQDSSDGCGEEGQSAIEEVGRVSAETCRRIACDASLVEMERDGEGRILDVGRRTRVVPTPLRRALERRDRGCRFPGCTNKICDAHHVEHWADGGATKLDNLLLLCRTHHRLVHEEGYRIELDADGAVQCWGPRGWPIPAVPASPALGRRPLEELVARTEEGFEIGPWTGSGLAAGSVRSRLRPVLALRSVTESWGRVLRTSGSRPSVPGRGFDREPANRDGARNP